MVHGVASKPEKPKRPELVLQGDAVEAMDYAQFKFLFMQYKKLAGITSNTPSHLLECLSKEIMRVLYSTYGAKLPEQAEKTLFTNIKQLVVKQRITMASEMEVLNIS